MPELCRQESVCGQACVYRHIARCVFTTIFINQGLLIEEKTVNTFFKISVGLQFE